MRHIIIPATFEDIHKALQISVDIGVRVFQRITYPGLRRQMDDAVRLFFGKDTGHRFLVLDRDTVKPEGGMVSNPRKARFFQGDIVIIIQIVDAHNLVSACQQAFNAMHADKPGCTCY